MDFVIRNIGWFVGFGFVALLTIIGYFADKNESKSSNSSGKNVIPNGDSGDMTDGYNTQFKVLEDIHMSMADLENKNYNNILNHNNFSVDTTGDDISGLEQVAVAETDDNISSSNFSDNVGVTGQLNNIDDNIVSSNNLENEVTNNNEVSSNNLENEVTNNNEVSSDNLETDDLNHQFDNEVNEDEVLEQNANTQNSISNDFDYSNDGTVPEISDGFSQYSNFVSEDNGIDSYRQSSNGIYINPDNNDANSYSDSTDDDIWKF